MSKSNLDTLLESLMEDSWDYDDAEDRATFALEDLHEELDNLKKTGREVVNLLEMVLQEPDEAWAPEFHDQLVFWKEKLKKEAQE